MCDRNCFNCVYEDCIVDDVTKEEEDEQKRFDDSIRHKNGTASRYKYEHSEKRKVTRKRYRQSEKGKEAQKRYAQSEKGREAQKRYAQSEKGKAKAKRSRDKRIASGKNAEACKRYYLKKKAEKVLKS